MADAKKIADEFGVVCPKEIDKNQVVLLADDQTEVRLILAHHLSKLGFRKVHQVSNGYEATQVCESSNEPVSIIIGDMEMPVMGGLEFLSEISENVRYQRGPFALAMDNPSKEKIMLATEKGVDEIMVKPYMLKDILPKMNKAFHVFHNPMNPEKVYEMAKESLRLGQLDKAKAIYKRLADLTQRSARPWVGLAIAARRGGDLQEAFRCLSEAEKRNPHYVLIYATRGELAAEQKDYSVALLNFKKAIDISPLNPLRYEAAAKILFEERKYQDAVDLLSIAVNNNLHFPQLHHFLSQGYYAIKDFKKAIRHIRSALALEPNNVVYLNQLGISFKESEQFDEAVKVYNSVIKLDPDNKAALYNKAVLLFTKGAIEESLKILERVVVRFPDFALAKEKLAEYNKAWQEKKANQAS